jgi:hypothetical protein
MGLGPHGAYTLLAAPLGGGVQVKDSTPREVIEWNGGVLTRTRTPPLGLEGRGGVRVET